MGEPIQAKWDVTLDVGATVDLGVVLKLKYPDGKECPAFLSALQARDCAERLTAAAKEVERDG